MEISCLTKGPEKVFIVVRNDDGASITEGVPLEWKADGTRDGIDAQLAQTAASLTLILGVAHVSAADQKYFLAQCYGYDDNAQMYAHGTATNSNVVLGDIFVASSGGSLTAVRAGSVLTEQAPHFAAMTTVASSDTSTVTTTSSVFIRCM